MSVISRNGACCFYTHQTSGACASECACDGTNQMEMTPKGDSAILTLTVMLMTSYIIMNSLLAKSLALMLRNFLAVPFAFMQDLNMVFITTDAFIHDNTLFMIVLYSLIKVLSL